MQLSGELAYDFGYHQNADNNEYWLEMHTGFHTGCFVVFCCLFVLLFFVVCFVIADGNLYVTLHQGGLIQT